MLFINQDDRASYLRREVRQELPDLDQECKKAIFQNSVDAR